MSDPLADDRAIEALLTAMLTRPSIPRVWNAVAGGKDNFAPDRALLATITEITPRFDVLAKANQQFLLRAAAYLVTEHGITQYLVLGTGLPADGVYLHEVLQALNPGVKVAYVDNDPIVVTHARAHLGWGREQVLVVESDIFDPDQLLQTAEVTTFLDWTRPIAIICTAALHYHPGETAEVAAVMQTYIDAAPAGSCTVVSHFLSPEDKTRTDEARQIEKILATSPIGAGRFRTREEIQELFPHQDLLDPGVVPCLHWPREADDETSWIQTCIAGGIGLKRG